MNFRDLNYFIAVAETGHVGKAAQRCFVSQPTLSMQLKKLEDELGVALFERQPKKLILSDAGYQLLAQAKQIVQSANDFKLAAKGHQDPVGGEFRLGMIPTICPYLLPELIKKTTELMPNLSLHINEQQTAVLIGQLNAGELDAAILATDEQSDLLVSQHLFKEDFFYATSSIASRGRQKKIDPAQLLDGSLLLLDEGHCLRDQGLAICAQGSAVVNRNYRATSMQSLLSLVVAGFGATLVPELVKTFYSHLDDVVYLSLRDPAPQRTIYLIYRKSSVRKLCIEKLYHMLARP